MAAAVGGAVAVAVTVIVTTGPACPALDAAMLVVGTTGSIACWVTGAAGTGAGSAVSVVDLVIAQATPATTTTTAITVAPIRSERFFGAAA
jgi:hypothetical protein